MGTPVKILLFMASFALVQTSNANQKESYKDLISKSQNLSLQHDRLQACQVLIRAIQKESKGSSAYRELKENLEELSTVFYTDQAQATFAQGESLLETKPKDAIDKFQEALKLEEGNVSILRALARAQLRLDECSSADTTVKTTENYDAVSGEYQLLKLQSLQCHKDEAALTEALEAKDIDMTGVEKFLKVFPVEQNYLKKDIKKTRQLLSAWEAQMPDYPEVYFWKWQVSNLQGTPDKLSAEKYLQLCKGLSARKRKSFNLDVDLCKSIDEVDAKLKTLEVKK